jgi:lysyl-tRNA synthetase class 1
MFAKYRPDAAFHIGMDDDVLRTYAEYDRVRDAAASESWSDEIKEALELSRVTDTQEKTPRFGLVASLLPLVNFDGTLLRDVLSRMGETYDPERLETVARRAEHWIRHWNPEKQITVNASPNAAYYGTLSRTEREWVKAFRDLLETGTIDEERLMSDIYAICRDEDKKTMRNNQKRLFRIVYRLVLSRDEGPRIPLLVLGVGPKKLQTLLDFRS